MWEVVKRERHQKGTSEIRRPRRDVAGEETDTADGPRRSSAQLKAAARRDERVSPERLIGYEINGCRIVELLGSGGAGQVYLAHQVRLDRRVAIKILAPRLSDDSGIIANLENEAKILARLNHPNILQVHDLGTDHALGVYYMIMEWVDGCNFDELIRRNGALPPLMVLDTVRAAAEGLGAAHRQKVIHRDVKPQNLMVGRDGSCKVADFGFALTADGTWQTDEIRVGTAAYMSPEQSERAKVDHRTDIYSLGCTAFAGMAGEPPFTGSSPYAVILEHRTAKVPSLQGRTKYFAPELDRLIARMMAKGPADRFLDVGHLLPAIESTRKALAKVRKALAEQTTESWLFGPESE